jgi:hypothetical protein
MLSSVAGLRPQDLTFSQGKGVQGRGCADICPEVCVCNKSILHPNTHFPYRFEPGGVAAHDQQWLDRLTTHLLDQYQPQSQATSDRARNALPRLRVRPPGATAAAEGEAVCSAGEQCTVCHDAFEEGKDVVELPCQHCFHEECVLPWLRSHHTCPVCRFELPVEDGSSTMQQQQPGQSPTPEAGAQHIGGPQGGSLNAILQNIARSWSERTNGGAIAAGPTPTEQQTARERQHISAVGLRQRVREAAERRADGVQEQRSTTDGRGTAALPTTAPVDAASVDTSMLGALLGGALGAAAGAVVAALLRRNRS